MSLHKVAAVSDVPEEGTLQVEVSGEPVCLYNLGGTIYATHDTCTHAQASLSEGFVDGDKIECPLHQGLFDIRTGKALSPPVTVDLKVYAVKIEHGDIYVEDAP